MTSKIVVNNIQADSGINTVTFGSNIIVSAGSTSSPAISPSGDSNTGIYFPAADTVCIAEGGTEVLRVNSSGNVGLGVTVPGSKLDVDGEVTIRRTAPGSEGGQINFARASDNTVAWNIDAYGSTSTPSLRFIDSIAAASRAEIDGSGNFAFNSGYGSVATAYGCRAWVNFNGTSTVAIRASGNVTSITDNGTGDYTVNFTTAMPDANYCLNTIGTVDTISGSYQFYCGIRAASGVTVTKTTTAVRVVSLSSAGVSVDSDNMNVAVFR